MPLVPGKANRDVKTFKIASTGAVLEGGMAPEIRDIAREYEKITGQTLSRIQIDDRRAQQLLVSCVGEDYYVVPAPELFSRHTGTCRVLGDKHQRTTDYQLQVGDFLRIGSVGLIVSELHPGEEGGKGGGGSGGGSSSSSSNSSGGGRSSSNGAASGVGSSSSASHAASNGRSSASSSSGNSSVEGGFGATNGGGQRPKSNSNGNNTASNHHSLPSAITEKDLFYLREDMGELRDDLFAQEEAATAAEEGLAAAARGLSPGRSPRIAQCYMCFDDEDTMENPLVAPCLCKGGTRYVHLTCLQKWQASKGDDKDCVITTSAEVKNTCKICKSKYKTHVRAKDGRLLPLLGHQLPPPFICFLVVTKHETAEELFNTQFQLSFAENKQILIGRSRNCHMVLDYRTVSTQHATVTFRKGGFFFRDLSSSNGSMLNLRRPMKLPYNQWVRIRYGRSIVAFKAKRSWMRRKLSTMAAGTAAAAAAGGGGGGGGGERGERGSSHSAAMSVGSGEGEGVEERGTGGGAGGAGEKPHHLPNFSSLQQENGTAVGAAGVGPAAAAAAVLLEMEPEALQRAHRQLLESLCRIDHTPRLLGRAGSLMVDSPVVGGRGGGRTSSLATGEEALGTALFQMHLQGASNRRVFDLTGGREEGEEEEEEEGEEEEGDEDEEEDEEEDEDEEGEEEEEGERRRSTGTGVGGGGVRFVPAESPMADSQVSQLSR